MGYLIQQYFRTTGSVKVSYSSTSPFPQKLIPEGEEIIRLNYKTTEENIGFFQTSVVGRLVINKT